MELEARFDVISREPVAGGHSTAIKEKLINREDGRERAVLFKRTSVTEVYALQVVGGSASAVPELIAAGEDDRGPWIVTPFYSGSPPDTEIEMPADVATALATVHAAHRGSAADSVLPVIDEAWLSTICAASRLAELVRDGRDSLEPILDRIRSWSDHPALRVELATQPRTLLHGDVHRNNVIIGAQGGHLVDWGPRQTRAADVRPGHPGRARTCRARSLLHHLAGADRAGSRRLVLATRLPDGGRLRERRLRRLRRAAFR